MLFNDSALAAAGRFLGDLDTIGKKQLWPTNGSVKMC
jgi:hypothetical protein